MEKTKAAENLSQWFNLAEQKPWEPGVYQVQTSWCAPAFAHSFWDGHKFCHAAFTFNPDGRDAILAKEWRHRGVGSFEKEIRTWRGLSSDQSAKPKPKARGNRKVTRYVVMREGAHWNRPIAVFDDFKSAEKYKNSQNKKHNELLYLETVRFRTHEAS